MILSSSTIARRANVNFFFILFTGLTVPTLFFTLDNWRLVESKTSQQRWCDANSHAGGLELTKNFVVPSTYAPLLYGDPTDIQNLCQVDVINNIKVFEVQNLVDGATLKTDTTSPQKDVQFGSFDPSSAKPAPSPITAASWAAGVVTITAANTFLPGQTVRVFGVAPSGYNGTIILLSATGANFTFARTVDPGVATSVVGATASLTSVFIPIDPTTATTLQRRAINAVRVVGLRTVARKNAVKLFGPAWTGYTEAQVVTWATAALDRRVIGFVIQKNWAAVPVSLGFQKIPMAPISLLSDPTAVNTDSWEFQVESTAMPGNPIPAKINYGTMTVNISVTTGPPNNNAALLNIGTAGSVPALASQINNGISATDVAAFGKNLVLSDMAGKDPITKAVVGVPYILDIPETAQPASGSADFNDLFAKLKIAQAAGTELVWPLYQTKVAGPDVRVTGFVAARITAAVLLKDSTPMMAGGPKDYISLTLQTTLLETPTAFTDYSYVFLGGASNYSTYPRLVNPYICRVRLVD